MSNQKITNDAAAQSAETDRKSRDLINFKSSVLEPYLKGNGDRGVLPTNWPPAP